MVRTGSSELLVGSSRTSKCRLWNTMSTAKLTRHQRDRRNVRRDLWLRKTMRTNERNKGNERDETRLDIHIDVMVLVS